MPGQIACSQISMCGGFLLFDNERNVEAAPRIRSGDELIDLKGYTQKTDFGGFRFPYTFESYTQT